MVLIGCLDRAHLNRLRKPDADFDFVTTLTDHLLLCKQKPLESAWRQLRKAMLHWLNLEPRPSMLTSGVNGVVASFPKQRFSL